MDVIRGFAILGIFFVNWPSLTGVEMHDQERAYIGIDAYIRCFYDLFVQTKFYTIFSFLFGLGFYIFMTRAETITSWPKLLFIRRLLLLLMFGALHFILLWRGDILHSYAVTAFLLLMFYKKRPKTVMVWAFMLLMLFMVFIFAAYSFAPHSESIVSTSSYPAPLADWTEQVQERFASFTSEQITVNLIYIPETLGLFLLGLYFGKKDIFRRVKELDGKLKKLQIIAFLLTLPSWYKILSYFVSTDVYNAAEVFPYVVASGKTLFIFYILTLLRMMEREKWQRLLRPFQYVGRMALTNYLLQTIATVLIFNSFFKNSAALPLYAGIPFCLVFYMLQIWGSRLWLSRFSYGPMEYIWRLGTYGRLKQEKSPG